VNPVIGWSRDDQTLFVQGPSKSKHDWEMYAWNSISGDVHPIGPPGIPDSVKLVSPDRTQILAVGPDERWWSYPVDGGEARAINALSERDSPIGWRADNRSIFIVMHHDENKTLMVSVLDIVSGQKTPWRRFIPPGRSTRRSMRKLRPTGVDMRTTFE
jgi:hypothetical protein